MNPQKINKSSILVRFTGFMENKPVWLIGLFALCLSFLPCLLLGENALFNTHDTYDGALLTYLLKVRHLGEKSPVYTELMNGLDSSGMEVPSPLHVLFYVFLKPYAAHLLQYIVISLTAYLGMYLCIKKITGYKIIATGISLLFSLLPMIPVYGIQVAGLPLLIYAFVSLFEKKRIFFSYLFIIYYVLSSSMVIIGFACIGILFVLCLYFFFRKKHNPYFYIGSLILLILYLLCNANLLYTTFLSETFVSHRVEISLNSLPFFSSFKSVFLASVDLAPSCHRYMIIPIFALYFFETLIYKHLTDKEKNLHKFISVCLILILFLCLFYAVYNCEPVIHLREQLPASIRHFQFHRVCMFLPILWYFVAGASLCQIWDLSFSLKKRSISNNPAPYIKVVLMILFMSMTIITIRRESIYRWNLNQLQNPTVDYGTSFAEYFAEEQFAEIKDYIGKSPDSYKVASLGLCPSIPLYNGFYCVDGYSNNYPLSYKYEFRRVIEKELNKNPVIEAYFDHWGTRLYLFADESGTNYNITKGSGFSYKNLEFDTVALKSLGCDYLLSAAPIENAESIHLHYLEVFKNDTSLYDVYLYEVN